MTTRIEKLAELRAEAVAEYEKAQKDPNFVIWESEQKQLLEKQYQSTKIHSSALADFTTIENAKALMAQVNPSVLAEYWRTLKNGVEDFNCEIIIPSEGVEFAFVGTGYVGQLATYEGIGITPEELL